MMKRRIALAVALLLSGVPGLAAQTRWTDPPTRTAAPSETNVPAQPEIEPPQGPASPKAVQRQAKRPPVLRSRQAERVSRPVPHQQVALVRRLHPVVASRPVLHRQAVLARRPHFIVASRPVLHRHTVLARRTHSVVASRPMPPRQVALVRRPHPVVASRPVPHRWTVLARRPYPIVGIDDVDPWTIRLHPWAGDLDCSGPYAFGVRRGLCPWIPARNPGDDDE
ncbi:hypothetical protein Mnod_7709 (plasmid) [Methylobacterium nodulans ORS 2060]|uniref:Uncharacterized protein n=1 Tax=Methylobacterium nodulans (strain LMG 21967 / CNCM I-2342 / ORS 2060) TaxID=460265 RepID=B8IY12_METNO|nr:hypothetical protein Mnod_7709 [Methylobacterium nodulans ORS 2060]